MSLDVPSGYTELDAEGERAPQPSGLAGVLFALLFAVLGGVLGIGGAAVQELRAGVFFLVLIIGAPIIEEGLKPLGVYFLLMRWPHLLAGQLFTAFLAAIGGLTFGVIEALTYVFVYAPDAPDWFVTYRFTLPLVLHTTGSFLVGLGINRRLLAWAQGEEPLSKRSRNLYLAAVALHAVYNTAALVLTFAGVFDFD